MKQEDANKLIVGIRDYIGDCFKPVGRKLRDLEERLKAMEDRHAYLGVWSDNKQYERHNSVTYDGGLWMCVVDKTRQRPAQGKDWRLAVRSGRDAR